MDDKSKAEVLDRFVVDLGVEIRTPGDGPLLLAHYTSVETVEQILRNNEIWFSNPLYMNDLEEMRVGIFLGNQIFPQFAEEAGRTPDRIKTLVEAFSHYAQVFAQETALDTYIFCTCQHEPGENGERSMCLNAIPELS
jgi:hypothetical protein